MGPMTKHRRGFIVVVAAALMGSHLVTGPVGFAAADSEGVPPPEEQRVIEEVNEELGILDEEVSEGQVAQGHLLEVAHRIFDVVDPTEGAENVTGDGAEYGYAGLSIDPSTSTLTLYWRGEIESPIQQILDQRDLSVAIEIVPAEYTLFEMQDAALGLIADSGAGGDQTPLRLALVGARTQGDGIVVEYYIEGSRHEAENDLGALIEQNTRSSGVRAFLVEVPAAYEELVERQHDISPYQGGAGYRNVNTGGYCSTGFGVRSRTTGNTFLLTAHHCFRGGTGDVGARRPSSGGGTWGFWRNEGPRNAPAYDATLLENYAGSISSSIFFGPIHSSTRAPITGAAYSTVGENVCSGGANSGTTCTVRVISKNDFTVISGGGVTLQAVVRGRRIDGTVAVVGGDSGGPVYSVTGGGRSARGIIVQGWGTYQASCSGVVVYTSTSSCYSGFVWTGVRTTLNALRMDLMTG